MKFLIAGLGSIGRRHLRNLLALGERDILLYRTHCATLPDDELAGFPVETDLRAALAHHPDAVIISNPTALHLDIAIPAAQCGCHILLEKPVSHSIAHVEELEQAVHQNRVKVLVGFQFRFHPGLRRVRLLLDEGVIGDPLYARAHWGEYLPNWHPWEDYKLGYAARPELGGGVVLTLSHPLDYLRWFLGEVESLWAFTSQKGLNMPVEDLAEIGLRFENGAIGSLHLDYDQRPPSHTLEITGTYGTIRWDNADGITRLAKVESDDKIGPWQDFPPPADFERNWMFLDEMRHFLDVLHGKAEPVCTLQDGINVLQLAICSLASSQHSQKINLKDFFLQAGHETFD
jgi:predicted dehydrogenase